MKRGFSLIEVLIFTAVTAVFFVGAASAVTQSLRQTQLNKNKIIAVHYAEELLDWIRSEKDANWGGTIGGANPITFTERASKNALIPILYCFNDVDTEWSTATVVADESACAFSLDGRFKRTVQFTVINNPVTEVRVSIQLKWQEGSSTYSVPLYSVLRLWE